MRIKNGLLPTAIQVASKHFDNRPDPADISLLVIHNISLPAGEFGTSNVERFFTGQLDIQSHPSFHDLKGIRVSAHLFIKRTGEMIQFVNFNDRAWHAGVSKFEGRSSCNDFSIGIELEGTDVLAYTKVQYSQLVFASSQIMKAYPAINKNRICGHSDIAPGRKTDPGAHFDWGRYLKALQS